MTPRAARPNLRTGLTLVELLAALSVLALAASLSIGALSGVRGAHGRLAAASAAEDALRRARLLARGEGSDVLVEVREGAIVARVAHGPDRVDDRGALDAARVPLPAGWTASVVGAPAPLAFDASGRCADALLALRARRGGREDLAAVEVLGLSGQTRRYLGEDAALAIARAEDRP